MKDYKDRNNFVQELLFGNPSFPCSSAFEKYTTKTELCNGKIYIKNYTLDYS